MKCWHSLFLCLMVLGMGSRSLLLQADYALNRSWYEANCENTTRPELECHGKCQVRKKSDSDASSRLLELSQVCFVVPVYEVEKLLTSLIVEENGIAPSYRASCPEDWILSRIHPPD